MMKDTILSKEQIFQTEVFSQGENGCHTYRIPALAQAGDGTLMAFAEARRDNSGDPGYGHIDLVCKLSHDNGESWAGPEFVEKSEEGWCASNPTVVKLRETGRVCVLYNRWKPGCGGRNCRVGELDNQLFLRYSDHNGSSWSDPVDITHQGRDIERCRKVVFGPGHGIETAGGRLVIPASGDVNDSSGMAKGVELPENTRWDKNFPFQIASFALYSDDGGLNWKRGEPIKALTNENQIVELDDGRLLIDARQGENLEKRWIAFSADGGETWSEPEAGPIVVPQICTSVIRYDNDGLLLWTGLNPGTPSSSWSYPACRSNLVLRVSMDRYKSFFGETRIYTGPAGYSDLCVLNDGSVGVIAEGGEKDYFEKIFFTRVSTSALALIPENCHKKQED